MYIVAKTDNEKIYHVEDCRIALNIPTKDKILFSTEKEAKEAGCIQCSECNKLARLYRKEKKVIDDLCNKHNMTAELRDGALYIDTCLESWKIIVTDNKHSLVLFHANKAIYRLEPKVDGKVQHEYHIQRDIRSTSIEKYLDYIWKHDEWILTGTRESGYKAINRKSKKGKKRYKAEKSKAMNRAIFRVCNIIERMEDNNESQ